MARASQLQREIRQRKPFRSLRQEAFLSILKTADALRRRVSELLKPFGITHQQYNVLRILRGAGSAGLPTLSIAERLIEETPGITRMLDRLEAQQWVVRARSGGDRRMVLAFLTPQGECLLAKIDPFIDKVDTAGLGNLTEAELEALVLSLDRIRAGGA